MGVLDTVLEYKRLKEAQEGSDLQAIPQALQAFTTAKLAAHEGMLKDLTVKLAGAKQGLMVDTNTGMITPDASLVQSQPVAMIGEDGTIKITGAVPKGTKTVTESSLAPRAGTQDLTKLKLTGDDTLTGPEYLESIKKTNPAYYNDLQLALNGTLDITKNAGRGGMGAKQMAADLAQATMDENGQPTFDPSQAAVRANVYKFFASGNGAQKMQSANRLIGHLGTLKDKFAILDPGQFPSANAFKNFMSTEAGKSALLEVQTALVPVSNEAATLFKGQGNSSQVAEGEIKHFRELVKGGNISDEQVQGFTKTLLELAASQVGALNQTLTNAPGTPIPMSLFTKEAVSRLKEFGLTPEKFTHYGQEKEADSSSASNKTEFDTPEEADASGLPAGTIVKVKGRRYQI